MFKQKITIAKFNKCVQGPTRPFVAEGRGQAQRNVKVTPYKRKHTLATPNYGYEKRQKELAKKRKKEDKLKSKSERKGPGEEDASVEGQDAPVTDDAAQAGPDATAPSA